MKKALALVLALVLALSMGVVALADVTNIIELAPAPAGSTGPKVVNLVELDAENVLRVYGGDKYYIGVEAPAGTEYQDLTVTATGAVSAKVLEFDPAKYIVKDEDDADVLTYRVDRVQGGQVVWTSADLDWFVGEHETYAGACAWAEQWNKENKTTEFKVFCNQDITIIEIVVPDNYSVSYKEGTVKISATEVTKDAKGKVVKSVPVSAKLDFIVDVTIFKYEEVKYAAQYGDVLSVGDVGYSDYDTAKYGYDVPNLSTFEQPGAAVVSTTAFRAIQGKDLTVDAIYEDDNARETYLSATIKGVAAGQKGVNFLPDAYIHYDADDNVVGLVFGFLGEQTIASDFVVNANLDLTYFELRELFGKKVEEEDVITYYILKDGKVYDKFTVDYMTVDYNDNIELEINGKAGSTLGMYEIVLEVPAAAEGEENPNTGAESVIGVVAAMAVVSVAAAAAVSLKK